MERSVDQRMIAQQIIQLQQRHLLTIDPLVRVVIGVGVAIIVDYYNTLLEGIAIALNTML
jgi:hypothetical protein